MTAVLANRSNEKRRELDYYPTPEDVTEALLRFLKLPKGTIWEPACGDGAMSKVIEAHGHMVISSDIRQTGYGEGGIDFISAPARKCDAIITNPPFGLAGDFIRRGTMIAPAVALLFKSQFWHAQKRTELFEQNPPTWILPLTWRPDFMFGERGGASTMDCLWSVWIKDNRDTRYRLLRR
jgi:hypothetical protein